MAPRMPEKRIRDIARAAVAVFSRIGFQRAQMGEIAKEAGISNGTLYYYFESKSHLFLYVMENGVPEESSPIPSPDASRAQSEEDALQMIRKSLQERGRLKCVERFLKRHGKKMDLAAELSEIFNEWWDVMESNRTQISILERSSFEFPELKKVFDKYGRRYVLGQVEEYLSVRMRMGLIRHIDSIPGMARAMLEVLAWFAWVQYTSDTVTYCPKARILPDLVTTFAEGLKKPKTPAKPKITSRHKSQENQPICEAISRVKK